MSQPDLEIYPDEYERLGRAKERLAQQFEFTTFSETDKRIFEMAAHTEFGEAGFRIEVNWQEIDHQDPTTGVITPTGVHIPEIEICGRNRKESETDHDRMRYGITHGLADGQPGYVRADGSLREDPRKKDIL